jgi:glycosyltransferase involved in cell wall biosynthesis
VRHASRSLSSTEGPSLERSRSPLIRVAVVFPLPIPYRDRLFELVAADPSVELTVFFCRRTRSDMNWVPRSLGYPHVFLRNMGVDVEARRNAVPVYLNPSILRELRWGRFDVIVTSGLAHPTMQLAVLYAMATATPYVVWNESHHMRSRRLIRPFRSLKEALYRLEVGRAAAGLVTGTYAADYLQSFGLSEDRVYRVANTTDVPRMIMAVDRCRGAAALVERRRLGLDGKKVVLFVGRLVGVKGVQPLMDAFDRVRREQPEAALVLVGDGPMRQSIEAWAGRGIHPQVILTGFKQEKDLPLLYALGDVFVLPSIYEPWGTVVNEAMAAGLPVVTTRVVGAAGDLVEDGYNGFVVPDDDAAALADAILTLLGSEELRKKMGDRSRERIASWTHEASATSFVEAVTRAWRQADGE